MREGDLALLSLFFELRGELFALFKMFEEKMERDKREEAAHQKTKREKIERVLPAQGRESKKIPTKERCAKYRDGACEDRTDATAEKKGRVESFGFVEGEILVDKSPKNDRQKSNLPEFGHDVKDHVGPVGENHLETG